MADHDTSAPGATAAVGPAANDADAGLRIEIGSIEDAWRLSESLPEFQEAPVVYRLEEFDRRLQNPSGLVLIARIDDEPVGFKVGYDRFRDGSWYSWMGGVVPEWRRRGIAERMLVTQERWVAEHGFATIYVKTRNRHKGMISFLAKHGYDVLRIEQKESVPEHRLLFRKTLTRAVC